MSGIFRVIVLSVDVAERGKESLYSLLLIVIVVFLGFVGPVMRWYMLVDRVRIIARTQNIAIVDFLILSLVL